MSTTNKVLKNSSIYGIVSILQKAIGFFLLPLYTSYLTPRDYGITAVVGSIVSFLSIFYMLSLNGAISRYFFDYKDDEEKLKEFWGTNILFIIINSFLISSILLIFHKFLLQPLAKGVEFYPYIFLGLISITLNPIYSIFQSTLQTKQNGKKYGLNNISYFIINLTLTILFVVFFKLQAKGVLLAASITDIIFFIYTLVDFIPKVKLTINKKYLLESLTYSLPLLPHSLAGWTMVAIDRLFLNGMKATTVVGLYNIGYQFGNIINILTTAVNQAYVPWFFEKMGDENKGRKDIVKFAEYAIVGYGFLAMFMSLFGQDILKIIVSKNFREGWKVIPLISFAYVFNGIYYFFVNPLFYNKNGTKLIPIGTFTSALLNATFNYILIPQYGMMGSALASLISMILSSFLILVIMFKIEKINFNWRKIYSITFFFLLISIISYGQCYITNYLSFFLLKIFIFINVSLILAFIYKQEIKVLKNKFFKVYMEESISNDKTKSKTLK